jgi:hypothetical protein
MINRVEKWFAVRITDDRVSERGKYVAFGMWLENELFEEARPSEKPAAGEVWFVKLPGAIALTELRVREATPLTVLVSVNGDWRDTRYAIADLTWAEKKA